MPAIAMAQLRLLLSHSTRRTTQPHRLLSLHFSSNAGSGSGSNPPPPLPIKPVSYAPKPQPPLEEAPAAAKHRLKMDKRIALTSPSLKSTEKSGRDLRSGGDANGGANTNSNTIPKGDKEKGVNVQVILRCR
ncbi:hypothetical protein E2562_022825 [Oryza meyeriana var. granulata]|uniref:Uncharacterized protein n=1 Tax=Oryza meyeriana var. granulata TaxID=110450 RepID=A0A6G1FB94_9ORYZ|nr:hypothetical protein E2562_022825 [Oryza meyeriana var. granulata]